MSFQPADSVSIWAFVIFSASMFTVIFLALKKVRTPIKILLGLLGYLIAFSALVISGAPKDFVIPLVPIMFASVILVSGFIAFSEIGRRMAQNFSLAVLIAFQAFRLPLEMILHHWAQIGTIPETMTWTGQNWDILTGVAAMIAAPFAAKNIKIAWAFQLIGCVLLLNVLRVVIFSSPFPFAWPLENPVQLIMYFPYALIGPLFVGPALAGHMILQRKLTKR